MAETTIKEFLESMPKAFIPEKAGGVDATVQLKLTGAGAGDWFVTIKDGKCAVAQGTAPAAKLTLTVDSENFIKLFTGKLDAMQAFMQGKIKLAGDMNLAMKLLSMFKMK